MEQVALRNSDPSLVELVQQGPHIKDSYFGFRRTLHFSFTKVIY